MTPFEGKNRVTSPFGTRKSPITGRIENHAGQDITTDGSWNVRECTGGKVLRVTSDKWRGNYVDIETAPNVFERYQHMQSINVHTGQIVAQGDIIGVAGNTGDSTGRHLHFGVYVNGSADANSVNPEQWSDVPNRVGVYAGNNQLDNNTTELKYIKVGPLTNGDIKTIATVAETLKTDNNGVKIEITEA